MSSPAFFVTLLRFEASIQTTMCLMITCFQCGSHWYHKAMVFPVLPSSVEDFEEWPMYTPTFSLIQFLIRRFSFFCLSLKLAEPVVQCFVSADPPWYKHRCMNCIEPD